ncbi:hypothetical protein [Streptomyces sp. YPW6]|uniref:hypothetical protein n=1 Tax=Streptomyces sp. YPW6 TaxID=2840373 RepID=UPI003D71B1E1
MRRRRPPVGAVIVTAILACVAATIGVVSCAADDVSSDLADQEMTCCWEDGATPAWLSGQLGIRIPEGASDRRAGYKVGQRYDTGLLSFVLPSGDAETYTGRLIEKDTAMIENSHPKERGTGPRPPSDISGCPNLRRSSGDCDGAACARTPSHHRKANTFNAASISSPTSSHPARHGSTSGQPSSRP